MTIIKGKHLGGFDLMGNVPPGTCKECAVKHDEREPHNQQSLFYQYKFFNEHGSWPTWHDAMSHCDEKTKEFWKRELTARGVKL